MGTMEVTLAEGPSSLALLLMLFLRVLLSSHFNNCIPLHPTVVTGSHFSDWIRTG